MDPKLQFEGYRCEEKHFICWDCLADFASSQQQQGAIKSTDEEGNLGCAMPKCKQCYVSHRVAAAGSPATKAFQELQSLKINFISERRSSQAVEAESRRLQADFERIMKIQDKDERDGHLLRKRIVEDVLTLRCPRPRCKMAFLDFNGCCALTCGNNQCNAGFCAWCLHDCGADAHAHVASCPSLPPGKSGVWASEEEWKAAQAGRKSKIIDRMLAEASNNAVAATAYGLLMNDIRGEGIVIKRVAEVRKVASQAVEMPWTIEPERIPRKKLNKYVLEARAMTSAVTKETEEFNKACGHFTRLLGQQQSAVTKVEVLEYHPDCPVRTQFVSCKENFNAKRKPTNEIWVFHGTTLHAVKLIAEDGFKVGGVDVPMTNGAAYGAGVYTAVGPNSAMGYARDARCVILARGMLGAPEDHGVGGQDFKIFRRSHQLLPCYVVHF